MILKLNNGEVVDTGSDTKLCLAKLLVQAMDDVGHSLTFSEARQYPRLPENVNLYAVYFGTLEKACQEVRYFVGVREEPEKYIARNTLSQAERAKRSLEFHSGLIRKRAEESNQKLRRWKMEKREEIMERVMRLCFEHGDNVSWISDDAIRRDPILVYRDVMRAFGGVKQLKAEAKRRLWEERHGKPKGKSSSAEVSVGGSAEVSVGGGVSEEVETTKETNESEIEDSAEATKETEESEPEDSAEATKEVVKVAKKRVQKDNEQLLAEVRAKFEEFGRPATDAEINADDEMSAPITYYRRLGSDYKARLKAEIEGWAPEEETKVEAEVEAEADVEVEEVTIPIKVIIPKGVKGTIQLMLEF